MLNALRTLYADIRDIMRYSDYVGYVGYLEQLLLSLPRQGTVVTAV